MYVVVNNREQILLERRQRNGLLGGMMGIPTTQWQQKYPKNHDQAPVKTAWKKIAKTTKHTFTHFHLESRVFIGKHTKRIPQYHWGNSHGLPTVFKKAVNLALPNL